MLKINQKQKYIKSENFLLIIFTFFSISFLFLLFHLANYGFDFTDEGYYLNNLEGNFPTTISYFAEIIRPIYQLFNKNLILLRILFWMLH